MLLYNIAIRAYGVFLRLAALFNEKAKLWIKGRHNWQEILDSHIRRDEIHNPVWFHCASLGEFEQGRPLIEAIRAQFPGQPIVLTFFSPSGYEIRKNYEQADVIAYLPLDTHANAIQFIDTVKPRLAVFVKYEFWLNFLFVLRQRSVPTYLVSAVFRQHQPFFKWYGGVFRKGLLCYQEIFTQDQTSATLLQSLHTGKVVVAGDTRFDRVLEICANPRALEGLNEFTRNRPVIIAGSTWPRDEEYLLASYTALKQSYPGARLIIAPHEINQANIERLWSLIGNAQLSSQFITDEIDQDKDVIIVNTMGYLSSIYQYGTMAVIGGGFNNGIHNILEPAVYGLPVLFGPNHHKFNEAAELIREQGGFCFSSQEELQEKLLALLGNETYLRETSAKAKRYVQQRAGATKKIMESLSALLKA